ncbi:uncharacterized protein [Ptychodera flava]|uniref:uncharacterized protein n=1 Tax=Ptychodera flava TaxID=63121 RepID=UPI00396A9DCD
MVTSIQWWLSITQQNLEKRLLDKTVFLGCEAFPKDHEFLQGDMCDRTTADGAQLEKRTHYWHISCGKALSELDAKITWKRQSNKSGVCKRKASTQSDRKG